MRAARIRARPLRPVFGVPHPALCGNLSRRNVRGVRNDPCFERQIRRQFRSDVRDRRLEIDSNRTAKPTSKRSCAEFHES